MADEEIKQAQSAITTQIPITSTEPHVHYSNFSTPIENSTDSSGASGNNNANLNDEEIEAVTELNNSSILKSQIFVLLCLIVHYL